ncbi:hypothetical protein GCM10009422_18520 [Brevundimonas kwangchunensis]|uniref:DUF4160 domain-containing protein n=1 Tax=Brevundimonas kwangchunensis TaxID=322163 RepID=A0ABN1GXM6_9CAUL
MNIHQPRQETPLEENDLFEMANLYPKHTGLPMTVWVSHRGRTRHDPGVKVCRLRGDRMDIDETAVVGIRPHPTLIEGWLDGADLKLVQKWISLNSDVLIGFWNGEIDTVDMVQGLKKL